MENVTPIMPDGWYTQREREKVYRKLRRRIQPLLDRASFFSRWAIEKRCAGICDRVLSRRFERQWGMSVVTIKTSTWGFRWPGGGPILHFKS